MKIFTKKGITQKIILIVIIAILWNFVFPTFSRADVFGILFDPITDLITGLGDTILSLLQAFLYNGKYDLSAGLGNIFINAGWFKNNQDKFPDMAFNQPSGVDVVEIDDSNFDQISLASILTTVVSPVAGVIAITADLLTGANYFIPTIQYSVDKIFAGKVPAYDINFVQPKDWGNDKQNSISIARQLSSIIATWYVALRNLAIVILLSVLVYIGIRIVISSSADDKAKYKQRVFDWLVAMCLIFFMHYIMTFTVSIVQILNDTIGDSVTSIPVHIKGSNVSYNTDLLGLVRLQVQYKDIGPKFVYIVFYVALLVYTCKYTWIYMKRTVTMAFLTIIAPLVAMTYPIDKLNDGKAQAFNAWLKEYIFTALLQPFHLIIYTVLVGSALNLATQNILYSILVIAFIGPAEKMLRKFFGFDKASTPGTLSQAGAMFGGAAAWNMTKKAIGALSHRGANPGGGNGGNGGNNNVRTAVENPNAPDSYGDYGRALNPGNGNNGGDNNGNNTQGNNTEQQAPEEEGRAYLPPEEERESQPQDPDDWDYNDMYLNPENYSDDYASANAQVPTPNTPSPSTPSPSVEDDGQDNKGFWKRVGLGALATAPVRTAFKNTWSTKYADGQWKRTLGNGATRIGKGALKFAGKAAVAGTVGAIGLGMGIAGDDLEDVLKYGAAGGVLGYSIAPGIGRRIANTNLARNMSTEMAKARYGSVEKAELARQEAELRQSGKMRQFVMDNFRKDGNPPEGKELADLENRAIQLYQNGFTDNKEIKRVMKLDDKMMQELNGSLPAEDIKRRTEVIGKMAREIKPEKLSNEDYVNEKIGEFEKGFKNANFSEAEAKSNAKDMMNNIKKYYKKP